MPEPELPLSIFHMLEKNMGKKIRVILDPAYGFEGTLMAVTHQPAGIWLSDSENKTQKNTFAKTDTITRVTAKTIRSSGLILTPSVSSSKNLSKPALAAGIGLLLSFFFLLILLSLLHLQD